jgi:2-polyprenyl-3-methyl-5-hydroxy-6-metoxy-1,4-benzoquinol methylase
VTTTRPVDRRDEYVYHPGYFPHTAGYLWQTVFAELDRLNLPADRRRVFEVGCGNGALAHELARREWSVIGIDPSESGVAEAQKGGPGEFHVASAYDDLAGRFSTFPAVISLEVVEHVYDPRKYARTVHALLEPGGVAILSTPYHGYWKNLALALRGKFDTHHSPLWDHGHIKFWSVKTLSALLVETGFEVLRFHRVGRIPVLAKSMIAIARRPV